MPYRRNPDGTYTRWTYQRNANGTYRRVSDRKPDEGMGGLTILLAGFAVAAIIAGIVAAVRWSDHHPAVFFAWTGGTLGFIAVIALIVRLSYDPRR